MTNWARAVERIAVRDDLHIAPFRADGSTYGTPTWIWSVVVDGRLFVRAWNGQRSAWYRSAMAQRAGRILAAGETHEVEFTSGDPELNVRIDEAYRTKYAGSPYLPPMVAAGPRAATVEVTPMMGNALDGQERNDEHGRRVPGGSGRDHVRPGQLR